MINFWDLLTMQFCFKAPLTNNSTKSHTVARLTGKPDQPRFTIIEVAATSANAAAALNAAVHCTC